MLLKHSTYGNSFNLHKLPKRNIFCYCTHLINDETEDGLFFKEGQIHTAYRLTKGTDGGATQVNWLPLHKLTKARLEINVRV